VTATTDAPRSRVCRPQKLRKARAVLSPLRSDRPDDPTFIGENAHAPLVQRSVDSRAQGIRTELVLYVGMAQDVDRRRQPQLGKAFRGYARGLAFVYSRRCAARQWVSNRGRLAVIKGLNGRPTTRSSAHPSGLAYRGGGQNSSGAPRCRPRALTNAIGAFESRRAGRQERPLAPRRATVQMSGDIKLRPSMRRLFGRWSLLAPRLAWAWQP
jgi:hypothetical protein